MKKFRNANDRFYENISIDGNGCWIWKNCTTRYGEVSLGKRHFKMKAHRYAWMLIKGEIPEGLEVCHKCDVPACCNPDHLFLGTHSDNMRDAHRKGRGPKHIGCIGENNFMRRYPKTLIGEKNGMSKVTDSQRDEIRKLRSSGMSLKELSDKFCLNRDSIRRIYNESPIHKADQGAVTVRAVL